MQNPAIMDDTSGHGRRVLPAPQSDEADTTGHVARPKPGPDDAWGHMPRMRGVVVPAGDTDPRPADGDTDGHGRRPIPGPTTEADTTGHGRFAKP
jgi:hypothetical protein